LNAFFLSADHTQDGRILHHLGDGQNLPVDLSARHKFPEPPDDRPRPQALGHTLLQRFQEKRTILFQIAVHHVPRRGQIIGDRGQRLIDFVCKRRSQRADRAQPRGVRQIGLQRLKFGFRLLLFGQIDDETGEIMLITNFCLPDFQLQREGRAILLASDDGPADADNSLLTGLQIAPYIIVVRVPIGGRHQDFDIVADDLFLRIAKHLFGGCAERADQAVFINHHHRIGNC